MYIRRISSPMQSGPNQLFLFQPTVLVAHNGFKFDFPLLYNEINHSMPILSPEQLEGIFLADSLVHLRQVRCLLFDDYCWAQQHDNNYSSLNLYPWQVHPCHLYIKINNLYKSTKTLHIGKNIDYRCTHGLNKT